VGSRTTVIVDSGFRRGSDVVKALAIGAKLVMVGRATLWGTTVGGEAGAARVINLYREEIEPYAGLSRLLQYFGLEPRLSRACADAASSADDVTAGCMTVERRSCTRLNPKLMPPSTGRLSPCQAYNGVKNCADVLTKLPSPTRIRSVASISVSDMSDLSRTRAAIVA
jgi:hypothetical protein